MPTDILDILNGLEQVLPILGTMTGHPELGILASRLLDIGEQEVERRSQANNLVRSEVLADAAAIYAEARAENARLKALGHETE